jgi:hypothetical protein
MTTDVRTRSLDSLDSLKDHVPAVCDDLRRGSAGAERWVVRLLAGLMVGDIGKHPFALWELWRWLSDDTRTRLVGTNPRLMALDAAHWREIAGPNFVTA